MTTVPDDLQPGNSLDAVLDWDVAAKQINTNTANIAAIIAALTNPLIAVCTAPVTVPTTGAYTDVTGCSITITTSRANVSCLVTGVFHFDASQVSPNAGDNATGALSVDGVNQQANGADKVAFWKPGVNVAAGATLAQQWTPALAAAGTHTLKLRVARSATTGGIFSVRPPNTSISVVVFDF